MRYKLLTRCPLETALFRLYFIHFIDKNAYIAVLVAEKANLLNEGLRLWRKEARIAYIIINNAVKHFLFIIPWKRRLERKKEQHKHNSATWGFRTLLCSLSS